MTKTATKIVCNNCGRPFHGMTVCRPLPGIEVRNERIDSIVRILGPLTTKERDMVITELLAYRSHWFQTAPVRHVMQSLGVK